MSQPPVSGPGLGEEPAGDPRLPNGSNGTANPVPNGPHGERRHEDDPRASGSLRLSDFAQGGPGDGWLPGPGLAAVLEELSGPDQRCPGASDDELVGLLGRWAALESWAAAAKLGVVRELIRRRADDVCRPGGQAPGELPRRWEDGTGHEVAAALRLSLPAAGTLMDLAWALRARLPGIAARLADGTIDYVKATVIVKELAVLDDAHAAAAEALIIGELAGKTAGQLGKLAALAVATVDPEGTVKRREHAERDEARVALWRENSGACALAGYGLPTDAALAAHASINQRAEEYKRAGVSPGARMDQLRVLAFCDILNGLSAADRIARAQAQAQQDDPGQEASPGGRSSPERDSSVSDDDGPATGTDSTGPSGSGPGGGCPGGDAGPALASMANLTFPLATLQRLAERPGEAHGFGPLDPALVRDLAAAAARGPHSQWCITITDPNGYAIGHGCGRPAHTKRAKRVKRAKRGKSPPSGGRDSPWTLSLRDGDGSWTLTLPGGRELIVDLGPVPLTDCDHRYESHSYQPSDTLRHLVEIRDGTCTFPSCSRHARHCDFEHAVPYDQGGRTCACNAGARSRRCHRVKQSKGWSVTQPLPSWHQWTTPSGRTYTQGPKKYPV
jgi:Domain of unknown function (DUF222)